MSRLKFVGSGGLSTQLEQVKTESAQKFMEILQLEYQANQKMAKDHPASRALAKTVEGTPPPAVITVVSPWSHDADALTIALDKHGREGIFLLSLEDIQHL